MNSKERRARIRILLDRWIADMANRREFRQNWDGIDDDIKREIKATWYQIAQDWMSENERQKGAS